MNSTITSKKDLYQAVGYIALLAFLSIPLSILGIRILNFVLGNVQI